MCNYVYKSATAGVSSSRLSSFSFSCSRRGWGKPLAEHSVAGKRLRPAVELSFITVLFLLFGGGRGTVPPPLLHCHTLTTDTPNLRARKTALLMLIYIHGSGVSSPNNGISRKCRCPPTTIVPLDPPPTPSPLPFFCADFVFPSREQISFMF